MVLAGAELESGYSSYQPDHLVVSPKQWQNRNSEQESPRPSLGTEAVSSSAWPNLLIGYWKLIGVALSWIVKGHKRLTRCASNPQRWA